MLSISEAYFDYRTQPVTANMDIIERELHRTKATELDLPVFSIEPVKIFHAAC